MRSIQLVILGVRCGLRRLNEAVSVRLRMIPGADWIAVKSWAIPPHTRVDQSSPALLFSVKLSEKVAWLEKTRSKRGMDTRRSRRVALPTAL